MNGRIEKSQGEKRALSNFLPKKNMMRCAPTTVAAVIRVTMGSHWKCNASNRIDKLLWIEFEPVLILIPIRIVLLPFAPKWHVVCRCDLCTSYYRRHIHSHPHIHIHIRLHCARQIVCNIIFLCITIFRSPWNVRHHRKRQKVNKYVPKYIQMMWTLLHLLLIQWII